MRRSIAVFTMLTLALAVGLAVGVSPYASASPDGLERVAGDNGFIEQGRLHSIQDGSPIPDYAFPGIDDERVATGLAGFVGTLVVFGIALVIGWASRRRASRALEFPVGS
jgi:hypothetical protein